MAYVEVLRKALIDRGGDHLISIRVLQEQGTVSPYLDKNKVQELWGVFKEHPVIFSDEIEGQFERFLDVLLDPLTVWFEVYDEIQGKPVGLYFLTNIYPGYEATGHFAYADRITQGRERMAWQMMEVCFNTYDLHRIQVEIPDYQTGTLRAARKLGFVDEGVKREAALKRGKWVDVLILSMLRSELMEKINGTAKTA